MNIQTHNKFVACCAISLLNLVLNSPCSFAQTGADSAEVLQTNAQPDAVSPNSNLDARPRTYSDHELKTLEAEVKADPKDQGRLRDLAVIYLQSPLTAAKGKQIFEELVKSREDSDSLMDLAACYYRKNHEETYRLSAKADKLNNGKSYTTSMIKLGMAEAKFGKGEFKEAEQLYQQTLDKLIPTDMSIIAKIALAGMAGVKWYQGDYQASFKYYDELYRFCRHFYGPDDIDTGWAILQMSLALEKLKRTDEAKKCYERAIYIFRDTNAKRIFADYIKEKNGNVAPDVVQRINSGVFGAVAGIVPPDPIDAKNSSYASKVTLAPAQIFTPWRRQFKQSDAPGYVWMDPDVPTRFVLVCVHGLGLHHKSFESFAKRVAREGVITVAFDVRGFGTYVDASGLEKISLNECVQDLKQVTAKLRADYAKYPLFILGESMGGAIALRVVSEAPDIVDGLICSVPSGARHNTLGTAFKVGTELLFDKTKPMEVGKSVVHQATGSESLRHEWLNDPSARLNLSAEELLQFSNFMNENFAAAKKITKKPVILFQGHNDKLVKESGTLELFDALSTPNKSIVILGNTEHLIFEAGQFKDDLTLGVLGWMDGVVKGQEQEAAAAKGAEGKVRVTHGDASQTEDAIPKNVQSDNIQIDSSQAEQAETTN